MVDVRGGVMRGCRYNGFRIIIFFRKCIVSIRVICRLVKRYRLVIMFLMVEGEGLVSRLIEVGFFGV